MELILFAAAAAFIFGASVLGLHNSVSNQSSKSSVSEALDNIEKSKEELDKKIKTQLLLGTVTIIAKIANWQAGREKAQKETINAIENANGGAATAIGMNITLDAIQAIGDSISDIVAIPDVGPSIPPFIPPVIPDVGPISSPLIPPSIPNDGPIPNPLTPPDVAPSGAPPLVPPKLDPRGIPPFIPPVEKIKELGGNILWSSGYQGAGKAVDDVVKKYSDDIYKYNYKEGVYKPTEVTTRNYDKLDEIAEEMYDSFRRTSDDVEKIAENTGWDIKDINQIKEHVFLDEVMKDSGMGRLDPDYEMAIAWERIEKGEFYYNDILLLKHELYESTYYRMNNCTQREAHDVTTKIFDWNGYVESLR